MVVGVDGYALNGAPDDRSPVPSAADAALLAAQGGADRATLKLSTVARVTRTSRLATDLTVAAEQSILHQWTTLPASQSIGFPGPSGSNLNSSSSTVTQWRNNTGVSAQLNTGLFDHFFLTGGLRVERASGTDRTAELPMLGSSLVIDRGPLTLKVRGAYGKGIRWPETAVRETLWSRPANIPNPALAPEQQSGVEGGADLMVGRAITFGVTRYDQTASGLIQRVMVGADSASGPGAGPRRISYQTQSLGQISNRGWELQGSFQHGPFGVSATLSLIDSRVRQLATSYTGELQSGDRMLDVPSRTMSLTTSWTHARWSASLTGSRAEDWISYDRLALVQALNGTTRPSRDFLGAGLRQYWITYGGVTHLNATMAHYLARGITASVWADNLLNRQRGEPDNVTVLPGRTISVGLRAEF
jgi:iron complex outermembrane receptor protein